MAKLNCSKRHFFNQWRFLFYSFSLNTAGNIHLGAPLWIHLQEMSTQMNIICEVMCFLCQWICLRDEKNKSLCFVWNKMYFFLFSSLYGAVKLPMLPVPCSFPPRRVILLQALIMVLWKISCQEMLKFEQFAVVCEHHSLLGVVIV